MILWTVAHQTSLAMGFSRQESWSGLPFPSPGDLPDPGIKSPSLALQSDSLPSEPPRNVCACVLSHFSCVPLFATLRTVAHQAPLSMGFSRQESWSALPCPPPGDLPNPGIKPLSPVLQTDSLPAEPQESPPFTLSSLNYAYYYYRKPYCDMRLN